jgi:homoserine dehydrogenase
MNKINVGLIGFGTVGTGVAKVLMNNADVIKKRLGSELVLKRVADKDVTRDRGIKLPGGVLTSDANDVLNDPEISIVIELVGGTTIAKDFILKALANNKHVVTANKALLSAHGREIFNAAKSKKLQVGFEASVAGGIPVLKALKEGLSANRIDSIYGIINGTANYILDRMTNEGASFEDVLKDAQAKGYAEADPSYDVDGIDTAHKLAILMDLAYGTYVSLKDIYIEGIRAVTPLDIEFAAEFGYAIKLLAISKAYDGAVEARVHPTMVPVSHPLASVGGVYNAVFLHGDAVGSNMYYGRGAGMMATASAVAADLVDIARDIAAGVPSNHTPLGYADDAVRDIPIRTMAELSMPYYLRFTVIDMPGVLSKLTGALGANNISIASVIQKGRQAGSAVPLVIVTHAAKESSLRSALSEIKRMDIVSGDAVIIRIEESFGGKE